MLVESILLALGGACAGAVLARLGLQSIVRLIPPFNLPDEAVVSLNGMVLLFCAGVSVLTGILFGLAPAFESARVELQEAIKDAARGQTDTGRGGKLRGALVVTEMTLSMVLLISAAFTLRSFVALETTDPGFRPERVLVAQLNPPSSRYRTAQQRNALFEQAVERLASLPQVRCAAMNVGGVAGVEQTAVLRGSGVGSTDERIGLAFASADFFRVLSIPLRKGRSATAAESRRGDRVGVVNESAVKQFWSRGDDPLGRSVTLLFDAQGPIKASEIAVTVVGVVGDTRNNGLTNPPRAAIYLPAALGGQPFRTVVIQTAGRPESAISAVRAAIHEIDRALPMAEPMTLDRALDSQRVGPRFMSVLFSVFAAMGLILAACGIYGVISYSVSRRTYEFGIRMALGAQRSDILAGVIRSGMKLAAGGVVLGLIASFAAARFYRDFIGQSTYLRNFNENDPWAIAGVSLGLLGVALAACYFPARRAASADPVKSLRYE
jgi:putative ABC transport system permease protein